MHLDDAVMVGWQHYLKSVHSTRFMLDQTTVTVPFTDLRVAYRIFLTSPCLVKC